MSIFHQVTIRDCADGSEDTEMMHIALNLHRDALNIFNSSLVDGWLYSVVLNKRAARLLIL